MRKKLKVLVIGLVLVALIGGTASVAYAQEAKTKGPLPRPWLSANAIKELREATINNITVANLLSAQAKQLAEEGDFAEAAELSSLSAEIAYKSLITARIARSYLQLPPGLLKGLPEEMWPEEWEPPFPPAEGKPPLPPAKGKPPLRPPAEGKPPWWQFWRQGEGQPPLPPPAEGKPPLPPAKVKPPLPPAKVKPPLPPPAE